jgi:hypothetical protein
MAFGYIAKNATNNVMLSDVTYNAVYVGKATLVRQYLSFPSTSVSGGSFPTPLFNYNQMSFDGQGKEIIPFCYVSPGNYTGVAYFELIGTVYHFYVINQLTEVPTVYCFAKSSSPGNTGWGMSVYDAAGRTAFTTKDNSLLIKAAYNAITPNSDLRAGAIDPSNSSIRTLASFAPRVQNIPLNVISSPPLKPAIMYYAFGTSYVYYSPGGFGRYFDPICKYIPATTALETYWGLGSYSNPGRTANVPETTQIALLIDGAQYD